MQEPLINLRIMAHCAFNFEGDSMDGQLSFATLDYAGKKKRTKRDVFLAEMAAAVPWSVPEAVIALHYPKEGIGTDRRARRPLPRANAPEFNGYFNTLWQELEVHVEG